jgi:hypothetical protein
MFRSIFFDVLLIVPDEIAVQTICYDGFIVITHVFLMFNTDGTADQCGNAQDRKCICIPLLWNDCS